MTDVMLDIETLGTKPGCIVLSLGAVKFDPTTFEIESKFYKAICFNSSVHAGLKCYPNTYAWWQTQEKSARDAAFSGRKKLEDVAVEFAKWAHDGGAPHGWWSQGSDFDFPILEAALKAVGRQAPWKYWEKRDTRTAYSMAKFDAKSKVRNGTYHNALADCLHQIECLREAFINLGLCKAEEAEDEEENDVLDEVSDL